MYKYSSGVRPQDHEIQTPDKLRPYRWDALAADYKEEVALVRESLGVEYGIHFANKFSRPFIPDGSSRWKLMVLKNGIALIFEPQYSFTQSWGTKFLKASRSDF